MVDARPSADSRCEKPCIPAGRGSVRFTILHRSVGAVATPAPTARLVRLLVPLRRSVRPPHEALRRRLRPIPGSPTPTHARDGSDAHERHAIGDKGCNDVHNVVRDRLIRVKGGRRSLELRHSRLRRRATLAEEAHVEAFRSRLAERLRESDEIQHAPEKGWESTSDCVI
jgi:hypothetical protein